MKWKIGQDVVAIVDSNSGYFKEGEIFTIRSIRKCNCNCCNVLLDIGINTDTLQQCQIHRGEILNTKQKYFRETYFSPLDEYCNISELIEVLNEPLLAVTKGT